MGAWEVVVYVMLPLPIMLCALVAAPVPRPLSNKLCSLADSIISFKVLDTPMVKLCVSVSSVIFLLMVRETMKPFVVNKLGDANAELNARARRWRNERNFWISTFIMAMWIMLYATYKLRKRIQELESKNGDDKQPPEDKKKI